MGLFDRRPFSGVGFGRKGLTPAPAAPPPSLSDAGWTYDRLAADIDRTIRGREQEPYAWGRAFTTAFAALSPVERGEILVSLAPMTALLAENRLYNDTASDLGRRQECIAKCLQSPYEIAPDHVRDFVVLVTGLAETHRTTAHYYAKPIAAQIKAAIAAGGHLTAHETGLLAAYARAIRDARSTSKGDHRTAETIAAAIDKIAGVEVSATALLMERCEDCDTGMGYAPLPPHFGAFMALFAATANALAGIETDLRAKRAPDWMRDEAAFVARFPRNGVRDARFEQWRDEGLTLAHWELREMLTGRAWTDEALKKEPVDLRDFAQFRAFLKDRNRALAPAAFYRDAVAMHASHDPLLRYAWHGKATPGIERLADLSDPQQTAFVEQLVLAKAGTRPPVQWLKQTRKLAEAAGTEARAHDWLRLFHTPCASRETIYQAINVAALMVVVTKLGETHPHWADIDAPTQAALAQNLALDIASGHAGDLPAGLSMFTTARDNAGTGFAVNAYSWDFGFARLLGAFTNQCLSPENEQIVRGLVWLLPHLPDRAAAVATLEACALAGISLKGREYRALTVTNAAIAALETIAGPHADLALLRLSQRIEDKKVRKQIADRLNGGGEGQLGV